MNIKQIAIDGTAGAGKSTLADRLAQWLGYLYIDTGAMYRAVTWLALTKGIDLEDAAELASLIQHTSIIISRALVRDGRQQTVSVNGYDATWDILESQVSRSVASVSRHPEVRALLIAQQRSMAQHESVVMVGRDIGTVVLPDAHLKLFLDASPKIRAHRRFQEIIKQISKQAVNCTFEDVLRDLVRRDELDRSNMIPAEDAIVIKTDQKSASQVFELVISIIEESGICEEIMAVQKIMN